MSSVFALKAINQQRDALAFNNPQGLVRILLKEAIDALLVDTLGGFENVEIDADCSGQVNKCLEILGEAKSTEADPCLQKLSADARVEAHCVE